MTRDDIIRMAQEVAGVSYPAGTTSVKIGMSEEHLERFVNLVAAAEREECAKVVEQAGIDGYGTLAAAVLVRERGAP
jgi:hypothetical protein